MRLLSLPILFTSAALCLTANAQPSEPFGAGGSSGGGLGGSMAVGGSAGGTGGNILTGGAPGAGGGDGGQQNGAGGGGVTAPVSAGAGGFGNGSAREIDKCNCRAVKSAPTDGLWLLVVGAVLTRCRRRSR